MSAHLTEDERNRLEQRLDTKLERVRAEVADLATPMLPAMRQHKIEVEIPEVIRARKRLANGVYGVCIECDEGIPFARLIQRPETRFCRDCLAEIEARNPSATRMVA